MAVCVCEAMWPSAQVKRILGTIRRVVLRQGTVAVCAAGGARQRRR